MLFCLLAKLISKEKIVDCGNFIKYWMFNWNTDSSYNKFRSIQLDMQYLINSQVFSQILKSNEMYINISKIILTAIYLVGVEVLRSAVFFSNFSVSHFPLAIEHCNRL